MAEMQPTMEILARISQNSKKNKDEVFTRLYRYLLRPDLYFQAYNNLYANNGAGTKGVTDDTADGFSEEKISKVIDSLRNETYQPKPSRRTYILKANGRWRPLGIPTFTDKLVQEVLRMVLESVYEPIFLNCSHGFRPKRSCHTALKDVKYQFHGVKWFVEGDIKGCFDNIDHQVLITVIGKKIKDARLIKLIYKFLKAGYLEDWKYHNTYSGTPQGGIISPLLANIYLHELDKYVIQLKEEFDRPSENKWTPEYQALNRKVSNIRRCLKRCSTENAEKRERLLSELKETRKIMLSTPAKLNTDKEIKYIRYADDFIIGVKGSREDCTEIKKRLAGFVRDVLKMELSEEKTLITYSDNYARFLGYDIRVRRDWKAKKVPNKRYGNVTKRTLSNMSELNVPLKDKIEKFLFSKGIVEWKNGELSPIKRGSMINMTDFEIVSTYNAELRGICNYYSMASNFGKLNYFAYLMEYSCLKTLAAKHRASIAKIKTMFKDGHGRWGIPYETKSGKKRCYFANYHDCKDSKNGNDTVSKAYVINAHSITTLESRLCAHKCELCGTTEAEHYEVHHVNKLKNLDGKRYWEKVMIAKRRKTLVLCRECHHKIHEQTEF